MRVSIALAFVLMGSCRLPTTRSGLDNVKLEPGAQEDGAILFTPLPESLSGEHPARISDQALAYPSYVPPERPRPLLELGDPFLDNGPIRRGIQTPFGQMLQPQFLVYGQYRSAVQLFDDGDVTTSEWANRIDLNSDLRLSGTERIVLGLRPLDSDRGTYTGFNFEPDQGDGYQEELHPEVTALFFEGELGEIFPEWDPGDRGTLDWGFSIGRQPLVLQDGILVDDILEMVGVTRNSLTAPGVSNLRITGLFAWNEVNRGDNRNEDSALLMGLTGAADAGDRTINADVLYVEDQRDQTNAWYVAAGSTQRLGAVNATFRAAGSIPVHDDTPQAGSGTLLFSELSKTLRGSDDIAYLNTFWSIDSFTSAARGDDTGSPVGRVGMLFEPVGMGRYGIPLGGPIEDTVGAALGYQKFMNGIDQQLLLELGARDGTQGGDLGAVGLGARYQRAIGNRYVLRIDLFSAVHEGLAPSYGARFEWLTKF